MRSFCLMCGIAVIVLAARVSSAQVVTDEPYRSVGLRIAAIPDTAFSAFHSVHVPFDGATAAGLEGSIRNSTETSSTSLERSSPLLWVRIDRAGVTRRLTPQDDLRSDTTEAGNHGHRGKHSAVGAAIGGGVGLVVGAAVGALIDSRPSDAIIPATPILAVVGLGVGVVGGLLFGTFLQ